MTAQDIPHNLHKLSKFRRQSRSETLILCTDGMYKYVNDNLCKFKLQIGKSTEPHDTASPTTPAMSWRKCDITYQIPVKHTVITVDTTEYKLHPKSSTKFCIERLDDHLHDYYFESPLKTGDPSLSKDVDSFLSLLK